MVVDKFYSVACKKDANRIWPTSNRWIFPESNVDSNTFHFNAALDQCREILSLASRFTTEMDELKIQMRQQIE